MSSEPYVYRVTCQSPSCGAELDVAENIGTTSHYVQHCPACGWEGVETERIPVTEENNAGLPAR